MREQPTTQQKVHIQEAAPCSYSRRWHLADECARSDAEAAVLALERILGNRSAEWTYRNADDEPVRVIVRWDTPDEKPFAPMRELVRVGLSVECSNQGPWID